MHSINEIREEYNRLDKLMNIDTTALDIAFSARSVRRYGSCKCVLGEDGAWRPVKIMIARFLENEDEAFWDTVRHEYAHAAAAITTGQRHGHDLVWREICRKVGCSGRTYAEKTKAAEDAAAMRAKYKIVCLKCGAESIYMRETKLVKKLEKGAKSISCRLCGGRRFDVIRLNTSGK